MFAYGQDGTRLVQASGPSSRPADPSSTKASRVRVFRLSANKSAKRYWPRDERPGICDGDERPGICAEAALAYGVRVVCLCAGRACAGNRLRGVCFGSYEGRLDERQNHADPTPAGAREVCLQDQVVVVMACAGTQGGQRDYAHRAPIGRAQRRSPRGIVCSRGWITMPAVKREPRRSRSLISHL